METKQCVKCGYYCNVTSFKMTGKWRINTCRWCKNDERKNRWHDIEKLDDTITQKNRDRTKEWSKENKEQKDESDRNWRNTTDKGYWQNKITSIRANCRSRGMECLINGKYLEKLYEEQKGLCVLTGRRLVKSRTKSERDTCSVDRIRNDEDYVEGNVRLITLQANTAKWTGTDEELLAFCKDVILNLPYSCVKDSQ